MEGVEVMLYVISFIWIGLELLCCVLLNGAFLKKKETSSKARIILLIAWILMCSYPNTAINKIFKQLLTLLILTSTSILIYRAKIIVHILLTTIGYIFITIVDTIVAYGTLYLLGISFSEFVWLKMTYITVTTVGKLLAVFFAWLIFHFRASGGLQGVNSQWLALLLLFPIISILMLILVFFSNQQTADMSLSAVAFSGILAIANIAILYLISMIEKSTQRDKEMELLKQQMILETDSYKTLEKNYSVQRKVTHEFQRCIETLNSLLNQGEYDAAQVYVNQLQKNRTLRIFSVKSHHPVIDVILNQKYQVASDQEISMQIQVNDLSTLKIQTDQLVVLLANLLDNAIEACARLENTPKRILCHLILEDSL